jgi:protein-disulfide isomerase
MMAALVMPGIARAEMTAEQKKEVEALVNQYILDHGDVLIESVNRYQAKQEDETNKQATVKAKELLETLSKEKTKAIAGNPDGKITVVEFFDYNCGYCKKAFDEVQSLLKDDKDVKIVFYDMPILGPDSLESAKWSLAAKKQDKYFAFHQKLMLHQGGKDESTFKKLAEEAGLDAGQLAKDKNDPSIEEEIKTHIKMAQELGIQGTPGFMINEKIFRGYIPYEVMQKTIADERAK